MNFIRKELIICLTRLPNARTVGNTTFFKLFRTIRRTARAVSNALRRKSAFFNNNSSRMRLLILCFGMTYTAAIGRYLRLHTRNMRMSKNYRSSSINNGRLFRRFNNVILLQTKFTMRTTCTTSHTMISILIFRRGLFCLVSNLYNATRRFVTRRIKISVPTKAKKRSWCFFTRVHYSLIDG